MFYVFTIVMKLCETIEALFLYVCFLTTAKLSILFLLYLINLFLSFLTSLNQGLNLLYNFYLLILSKLYHPFNGLFWILVSQLLIDYGSAKQERKYNLFNDFHQTVRTQHIKDRNICDLKNRIIPTQYLHREFVATNTKEKECSPTENLVSGWARSRYRICHEKPQDEKRKEIIDSFLFIICTTEQIVLRLQVFTAQNPVS
mmetsp:Transcript_2529/g.2928  ORF Transcript_2529/g.2928 Transcript_2529/m.2928 type:complete len:201 (-) Transcript_2529:646-1248(-)